MINARQKGHKYELQIRDKFIALGFSKCVTSRLESKSRDDAGVDLCYTGPFNVQCKAIENLGSSHAILARMPSDGYNVVFHKKNNQGSVVSMTEETFFTLASALWHSIEVETNK